MDAAAVAAQSASTLQQIARLVQGQRYGEAETLCQQFLQREPENPEALHWLGAIAYAVGNYNRALNFTGEALMRQPDNVAFLNTAGLICKAVGTALTVTEARICVVPAFLSVTATSKVYGPARSTRTCCCLPALTPLLAANTAWPGAGVINFQR